MQLVGSHVDELGEVRIKMFLCELSRVDFRLVPISRRAWPNIERHLMR
jgi:hypothetical protein